MKNMQQILKQAQQMQEKMAKMQEKTELLTETGNAAAGMVSVTVNGKGNITAIKLDKSVVDPQEVEMLEDLIIAAFNDGKAKVDDKVQQEMSDITGGLNIPGMKLPF